MAHSTSRTTWRRRLAILLASFLVTMLLAELGAVVYTKVTHTGRGVVFDRDFGWRHLPHVRKVGEFWSAREPGWTNARGWRDAETELKKSPGLRRVVAVGDSFTFGVGVDYGQRFTEMLEAEIQDLEVINLGVNAFGTDQELLVLEREGFLYDPDVVVLMAFLGNDLKDILYDRKNHWPKPHFTLEKGELVLERPRKSWDVKLRTSSYVGEGLFRFVRERLPSRHLADDAPDPIELFEALVLRAARSCVQHGAELVVVLVYSDRPEGPDVAPFAEEQAARERILASGVSVLDTWDLFRERSRAGAKLYVPDGHWNEDGHRVMAKALADHFRANGWLE